MYKGFANADFSSFIRSLIMASVFGSVSFFIILMSFEYANMII